ncbi:MAG: ATP-binding cassette domain-containing protein, partial [Thermoleophilia bacterium]
MGGLAVTAEHRLGELELGVALEVAAGECLALAGPSGAGKSSVLRAIAGLRRPERGHIACGERVWLDR